MKGSNNIDTIYNFGTNITVSDYINGDCRQYWRSNIYIHIQ